MLKDRLIADIKDSIYTRMHDAVGAGEDYLARTPDMRFQFETNSKGEIETHQTGSAAELIKAMDTACGGFSISSINEAFGYIQDSAIEMGREVTRSKSNHSYKVIISPVMN